MKKFILISIFFVSGCSTLIHGSRQDVSIITTPPSAIARIDSQSCMTPCTLQVSRLSEKIYISANNIEREYPLSKNANAIETYLGNAIFLIGMPIGVITDNKSGAKWTIEPVNIILP